MSQYEYSDQNKRKRFSALASAPGAYPADTSGDQQFLASPHSADIGGDQQLEPDYYRSAISPAHASSSGRFSDAASHHSQPSFASHGTHPSQSHPQSQQQPQLHSHLRRPSAAAGKDQQQQQQQQQPPHPFGDGSSTIATINSADLVSLKRDREREGRCSECGAQTHELRVDQRTGARTKEPLNVEGEVRRGR